MDQQLIDQLRAYRGELAHEACAHGFAQRIDRDKVLARMLAADRLLALVVQPLPPVAYDPDAGVQ